MLCAAAPPRFRALTALASPRPPHAALYVMPRLLNDFMATAREMGYSPDDISLNEIQMTILAGVSAATLARGVLEHL